MQTLVVGGGQAAAQLAHGLREQGYTGAITVVGEEPTPPYQRPPLSKAFLLGELPEDGLILRSPAFYAEHEIEVRCGTRVEAVRPGDRRAVLADGTELHWDHLVFATGARARPLPLAGAELPGVHRLRTIDDACAVRQALEHAGHVVLVGGGFIGLELAAVAAAAGAEVVVLEGDDRIMRRSVTPPTSSFVEHALGALGVRIETGCAAAEIVGHGGRVDAVVTTTGRRFSADLVVVGVGAVANDELARDAGLAVADGVLVDEQLRTADPAIFAIGDCARFCRDGARIRLESVQNATDQAHHVARDIVHDTGLAYDAVPWFWSHQGPLRLQMAGLVPEGCDTVCVGDVDGGRFSVLAFCDDRLVAVDSINRPADHVAARRHLAEGTSLSAGAARAPGFSLRNAVTAEGQLT